MTLTTIVEVHHGGSAPMSHRGRIKSGGRVESWHEPSAQLWIHSLLFHHEASKASSLPIARTCRLNFQICLTVSVKPRATSGGYCLRLQNQPPVTTAPRASQCHRSMATWVSTVVEQYVPLSGLISLNLTVLHAFLPGYSCRLSLLTPYLAPLCCQSGSITLQYS